MSRQNLARAARGSRHIREPEESAPRYCGTQPVLMSNRVSFGFILCMLPEEMGAKHGSPFHDMYPITPCHNIHMSDVLTWCVRAVMSCVLMSNWRISRYRASPATRQMFHDRKWRQHVLWSWVRSVDCLDFNLTQHQWYASHWMTLLHLLVVGMNARPLILLCRCHPICLLSASWPPNHMGWPPVHPVSPKLQPNQQLAFRFEMLVEFRTNQPKENFQISNSGQESGRWLSNLKAFCLKPNGFEIHYCVQHS